MTPAAFSLFALTASARLWFVATLAGQLIFGAYVVALYGGAAAHGNLKGWNQVMLHGYVAGDAMGNTAVATHLLMATVIMLAGALQLVPQIRARAPRFHRWNGRAYLLGAVVASVSGLYMLCFRGAVGDAVQHVGTGLNGLLVLVCAAQALRHALRRDFAAHSRWALRLFLCVSGVWFFRIGLMFWIAIHSGPAGFDPESFTGPFLSVLAYAQFLLPLAVLELYLRGRSTPVARWGVSLLLVCCAAVTSIGVAVATMGMWLPHMT